MRKIWNKLFKNTIFGFYYDNRELNIMKKNKVKKLNKKTFTKKWINIILTVSIIDVQLVFLLAFLGKEQIAETLGIAIITEIVSVSLAYMVRAFFDTHTEAKDAIELERVKREYHTYNNDEVG